MFLWKFLVFCFFVHVAFANVELEERISFLEQEVAKIKKPQNKPIVNGFFQQDYAFFSTDDQMKAGLNPATKDGSLVRRAYLGIRGKYNDKISYNFTYNLAKARDLEAQNLYIKYRGDSKRAIYIGHTKEPFGLETLTSSKSRVFMESAVSSTIFSPSFNSGILFADENTDNRFYWAFGFFNDDASNDGRTGLAGTANWNRTLRTVYTPFYKEAGKQLLHLGASYSYRNSNGKNVRMNAKPESALWDRNFLDTGNMVAESTVLDNIELAWVHGSLSVQAEYTNAEVKRLIGGDNKFSGHYIFASYFLTGEHRSYNRESRVFGLPKPLQSYTDGGRGAWEVVARYSEADLNSGTVAGGELSNWTLGLNWIPIQDALVFFNYIQSDLENGGSAESANMRMQFAF